MFIRRKMLILEKLQAVMAINLKKSGTTKYMTISVTCYHNVTITAWFLGLARTPVIYYYICIVFWCINHDKMKKKKKFMNNVQFVRTYFFI